MAQVKLRHVLKIYDDDVVAAESAVFGINDKEVVVRVGPSSCGTSTFLIMIADLEYITSMELQLMMFLSMTCLPKIEISAWFPRFTTLTCTEVLLTI